MESTRRAENARSNPKNQIDEGAEPTEPSMKENTDNMSKKSNIATAAKRLGVTAITAGLTLSPFMPIAAYADELNDANTPTTGDAFDGETIGANVGTGATATKLSLDDLIARAKQRVEEQQKVVDQAQAKLGTATKTVAETTTKTTQAQQDYDAAVASQNSDEVAALQKLIDEKKQALADLEAKQAELEKLQSQQEAADTDASNKQLAYMQAQQKVEDAKSELDKAEQAAKDATPEKLNAAQDAYDKAKSAYDEAVAAKDKAEAELSQANDSVTSAEAGVTSANGKLTDAQDAAATAKANLQSAQSAYDSAKAAYDAIAGDDPDKLAEKIDAAKSALDSAKSELDAATAADATAQANLTAAQNAVPAAQEKVSSANAAVSSAQAAYDEASEKLAGITDEYNAAKTAYVQAQQTEADKKAEYERLVSVCNQKKDAYDAASNACEQAKKDYETAADNVTNLENQISDLKSTMTVDQDIINQGMAGFMNYINAYYNDATETQRKNASEAQSMLMGASPADWYDKYVDSANRARSTNPLSLTQMRNALTYLDTQNNIRKANGQSELSISLRMTAAAALNASYSSNIWGHSGKYYDNAENLASGGGAYTGGDTIDTLGWPYSGFYTAEKAEFEKYVAKYGNDLDSHRYDSYYISSNYKDVYAVCGHYINLISKRRKAFGVGTGSGKTADGNVAQSMVTVFDYSDYKSEADFTVAEFKKILNDYIDSAYNAGGTQEQKEQLQQLQNQLLNAQKDADSKHNDYTNKVIAASNIENEYDTADAAMKSAKADYDSAQTATASAKGTYDDAVSALGGIDIDTLKSNLSKAKSDAASAQSELDAANAKLADCQKMASDASTRKSNAQSAYDAAKAAYENLTGTDIAGAKERLDKATSALNDAKAADSDAQTAVSNANSELLTAQSKLDKANAAKENAKSAYDKAFASVSSTKDGMDAAKTTYDSLIAAASGVDFAKKNLSDALNGETDAKTALDKANDTVSSLNDSVRDATATVVAAKSVSDAKSDIYDDVIANKADYIAGTKTTGNADVDALFKSVRDKQADVDQAKAGLDAAKAEHGEASDAYAAAKKIYDDAVAELNSRQAELDALLAHKRDDEQKANANGTNDGNANNGADIIKPAATITGNGSSNGNASNGTNTVTSTANGNLPQTGEAPNFAAAISVIGGALVASGVILKKKRQ